MHLKEGEGSEGKEEEEGVKKECLQILNCQVVSVNDIGSLTKRRNSIQIYLLMQLVLLCRLEEAVNILKFQSKTKILTFCSVKMMCFYLKRF